MSTFYNTIDKIFTSAGYVLSSSQVPIPPTATKEMRQHEQDIELNQVVKQGALRSINGWLSPNGTLFSCRWQEHSNAVRYLGYRSEAEIESAGFIKLSQMVWMLTTRFVTIELTPEQLLTINQWHEINQLDRTYFDYLLTESKKG